MITTHFTGSKIVGGKPMSRGDFLNYINRDIDPEVENATDAGFLVEYLDGGKANHPGHVGYISWSPADVFKKNYLSIGDITGLAPHIVRLKAERAENFDRLQKLKEFMFKQELLAAPSETLTDAQREAIVNIPQVDPLQYALMQEQLSHMARLEDIYTARFEALVPGARVEHEVTLRFSIANGTRFNIMPLLFEKLAGQIDECCYTGTICNIIPASVRVYDPQGKLLEEARALTEKLVRGFAISGDIGDQEHLFDVAVDRERGVTWVTSSFEEAFEIEMIVQLADHNRRVV